MDAQPFTIKEALKEGWKLTKANLSFLICYQIILFVIHMVLVAINKQEGLPWTLLYWAVFIIAMVPQMGFYNSALLITAWIKPAYDQLYKNWRLLLSWFVAGILISILLIVGYAISSVPALLGVYYFDSHANLPLILLYVASFLLFVFVNLYVFARYGLYTFFILDKGLRTLEALKRAEKATEGIRWQVALLFLACFAVNLLGLLLLVIGLLFTVPTTLLAIATVYRKISYRAETHVV